MAYDCCTTLVMDLKNANGPLHVKVDIVSSNKFSAEVRHNLHANYKQALYNLNYQIPSCFH